jgi:branched-chain amino acid transport system ATP-binding protein
MTSKTPSTAAEPILKVAGLTKNFGGLRAVHNIDLELHPGDLAGLIGPNGAGKTTVFNLITGVYIPTSGNIIFNGQEISGLAPHVINHMGIARTFQNIRLFPNLTVLENVCIAYHSHAGYSMQDAVLRNGIFEAKEKELIEKAQDFLEIFQLEDRQAEIARNLPYGKQRRLEIARALAADPKLLFLDEPAAGMNPAESVALMDLIHFIRDRFKLTILLIEHQMRVVMGVCEKITVMDFGEKIAYGVPKEIQSNPRVVEAYLGPGSAALSEKFRRSKAQ